MFPHKIMHDHIRQSLFGRRPTKWRIPSADQPKSSNTKKTQVALTEKSHFPKNVANTKYLSLTLSTKKDLIKYLAFNAKTHDQPNKLKPHFYCRESCRAAPSAAGAPGAGHVSIFLTKFYDIFKHVV